MLLRRRKVLPFRTPASQREADALAALERGDRDGALAILIEAFGLDLFQFCVGALGEQQLAEDVVQRCYAQAHRSLRGFRRRSTLRTWLFAIARHRCLDALKQRRRWQARHELRGDIPDDEDGPMGTAPDEQLMTAQERRAVRECLASLNEDVRMALVLRCGDELTYVEMGEILAAKPGTLEARVRRGLVTLRRCLQLKGVHL